MQARRSRAQLGAREAKEKEPRRVGCGKSLTGRHIPPVIHTMRHFLRQAQFFFGEADFFSAKRLFLRVARDVSGAHRVPPWAREGESRK